MTSIVPPRAPLAGRYRYTRSLPAGPKSWVWLAVDEQTGLLVIASALGRGRLGSLSSSVGVQHDHLAGMIDIVHAPDPEQIPSATRVQAAAVCVAEYVPGGTLHDQLRLRRLGAWDAATWFARLADALSSLHAAGCAHGAISPRCIVIAPEGRSVRPVLTQLQFAPAGAYCTPERVEGGQPTADDDVWALHAALYAALVGASPFEGKSKEALTEAMRTGRWTRLAELGAGDPELHGLLERGLAPAIQKRTVSAAALRDQLAEWARRAAEAEWSDDQPRVTGVMDVATGGAQVVTAAATPREGDAIHLGSSVMPGSLPPGPGGVDAPPSEPPPSFAARADQLPPSSRRPPDPEPPFAAVLHAPSVPAPAREDVAGAGAAPLDQPGAPPTAPLDLTPTVALPPMEPSVAPTAPVSGGVDLAPATPPGVQGPPRAGRAASPAVRWIAAAVALVAVVGVAIVLGGGGAQPQPAAITSWRPASTPSARPPTPSARPPSAAPSASVSASIASTAAPAAHAPPTDANGCAAAHFADGTFRGTEDFAFVCSDDDLRSITSRMHSRLVTAGTGKVTAGMKEWSMMSWYQLAATATTRLDCCPAGTKLTLPDSGTACTSLESTLIGALSTRAPASEVRERAAAIESTIECMFRLNVPRPYPYKGRPSGANRLTFEAFLRRSAAH